LRRGQVSSPDGVDPEEWRAEWARQLGHEIDRSLRHDQENIAMCTRRPARIYARFDTATPIVDGKALDTCRSD
jgi:hypothetical protein